ncbi:hypothetical protein ACSFA0_22720 [Variovorax sp. LT1P1]|uniref:hypothetical protein n=1 Tax=Variovorax sp. LT1P1 TaxID=3443730 RepID=UPI003F45A827
MATQAELLAQIRSLEEASARLKAELEEQKHLDAAAVFAASLLYDESNPLDRRVATVDVAHAVASLARVEDAVRSIAVDLGRHPLTSSDPQSTAGVERTLDELYELVSGLLEATTFVAQLEAAAEETSAGAKGDAVDNRGLAETVAQRRKTLEVHAKNVWKIGLTLSYVERELGDLERQNAEKRELRINQTLDYRRDGYEISHDRQLAVLTHSTRGALACVTMILRLANKALYEVDGLLESEALPAASTTADGEALLHVMSASFEQSLMQLRVLAVEMLNQRIAMAQLAASVETVEALPVGSVERMAPESVSGAAQF